MIRICLVISLLLGIGGGSYAWNLIRAMRYARPIGVLASAQQFLLVLQYPPERGWAVLAIVAGVAVMAGILTLLLSTFYASTRRSRGATLTGWKTLRRLTVERTPAFPQVVIGGIPLPLSLETNHLLMVGATGTGKTNAQMELLEAAIARGDRVVVVDPDGVALSRFGRPGDVVLNPFDKRSARWSLFNEIKGRQDYDRVAAAVVPISGSSGSENEWRMYAKQMLADILSAMASSGEELNIDRLVWWANEAPRAELRQLLAGTGSAGLFQPDAGKALDSTRFVLASFLRAQLNCTPGKFSLQEWVVKGKGNLYLTWRDDMLASLKPLVSCWLELLVSSVLSSPPQRRRLWLFIDELGSLERMASLESALTKGRKYGLRVVACLQAVSQLADTYGPRKAETLRSCFRSLLALGGSATDADTAEAMSKGLGEAEQDEDQTSTASSGNGRTVTTATHVRLRRVVMASEIQMLAANQGYLKLAGPFPVALVMVKLCKLPARIKPFLER